MSVSGREALPNVREWSGGAPGCPGMVERISQMFRWSGRSPECPGVVGVTREFAGVVGKSSRMSRSGWEALPDVRKWSRVSPGCLGVVGRPSRMSGSGL